MSIHSRLFKGEQCKCHTDPRKDDRLAKVSPHSWATQISFPHYMQLSLGMQRKHTQVDCKDQKRKACSFYSCVGRKRIRLNFPKGSNVREDDNRWVSLGLLKVLFVIINKFFWRKRKKNHNTNRMNAIHKHWFVCISVRGTVPDICLPALTITYCIYHNRAHVTAFFSKEKKNIAPYNLVRLISETIQVLLHRLQH